MIDALAGAAAETPALSSRRPGANDRIDQQQFLMLFIEQLKNQDPLAPLEPDQLTAQLAQFSSLEQLTGINTRLDTLAASTRQHLGTTLLGLLGREVLWRGDRVRLDQGQASPLAYRLPEAVQTLTVTIRDAAGRAVRSVSLGAQDAGEHVFVFDGRAADGGRLPDGEYHAELAATVAGSDQPLVVPTAVPAVVDGVDFTEDPPALLARGQKIPLEAVLLVRPPAEDE